MGAVGKKEGVAGGEWGSNIVVGDWYRGRFSWGRRKITDLGLSGTKRRGEKRG